MRNCIASNLAFSRDHRNATVAIVEIARNAAIDGVTRLLIDPDLDVANYARELADVFDMATAS